MMQWKQWFGLEKRNSAAGLGIRYLESQALGRIADPSKVGVCQSVANAYSRAFEGADLGERMRSEWLTGAMRSLVLRGEFLGQLVLGDDRLFSVVPAVAWDVIGSAPNEQDWVFDAEFASPDSTITKRLSRDEVIFLTWASNPMNPWKGLGPWDKSQEVMTLQAVNRSIHSESTVPIGRLVEFSKEVQAADKSRMAADLARLKGGTMAVSGGRESDALRFTELSSKLGIAVHPVRRGLEESICAAAGVPASLVFETSGGATSSREGYRRWFSSMLKPLASRIEVEVNRALGPVGGVKVQLRDLAAADIMAKARAAGSLAKAADSKLELSSEQILQLAGLA